MGYRLRTICAGMSIIADQKMQAPSAGMFGAEQPRGEAVVRLASLNPLPRKACHADSLSGDRGQFYATGLR